MEEDVRKELADVRKDLTDAKKELTKFKVRGRNKAVAGLGGAVLGGGAGYVLFGDYLRSKADAVEEVLHAGKVATSVIGYSSNDYTNKYLGRIDPVVKNQYDENVDARGVFGTMFKEGMEGAQRGSLEFPGQETKPVRGVRDLKGWIIEKTKGAASDEQGKENITLQNKDQYQENYNALAEERLAAVERRELLRGEIKDLAGKLYKSEANTGNVDESGIKALEGLVVKYNQASDVLKGVSKLDNRDLFEGSENAEYSAVVQQARDYGIQAYQPVGTLGDALVLTGVLASAWLGNKLGRGTYSVYNGTRALALGGARVASGAGQLIGKGCGVTYRAGGKVLNKLKNSKVRRSDNGK